MRLRFNLLLIFAILITGLDLFPQPALAQQRRYFDADEPLNDARKITSSRPFMAAGHELRIEYIYGPTKSTTVISLDRGRLTKELADVGSDESVDHSIGWIISSQKNFVLIGLRNGGTDNCSEVIFVGRRASKYPPEILDLGSSCSRLDRNPKVYVHGSSIRLLK